MSRGSPRMNATERALYAVRRRWLWAGLVRRLTGRAAW